MKRLLSILIAVLMFAAICPMAFAEEAITSVNIINADVDAIWGVDPADALDYEVTDDTGFHEYDHYWYDEDEGVSPDIFLPGHYYSLCWDFEVDEGYEFTDATTVSLNGSTDLIDFDYTGIDWWGDLQIWTKPMLATEDTDGQIMFVPVDDVPTMPEAGKTAAECDFEPTTASDKFTVVDWAWFCDTDNETMNDDDVFDVEKEYSIWIDLEANSGYHFDDYLTAYINGTEDTVDFVSFDDDDDTVLTVWTYASAPMNLEGAPEAYLIYDGVNGNGNGIYMVDMGTGAMMPVKTFSDLSIYAMEKINGKFYGYTSDFDYVVFDAETYHEEYAAYNDEIGEPTLNDITADPDNGIIYAVSSSNATLGMVNPATGEITVLAELDFAPMTIAYADGALYCTVANSNEIYKINPETYEAEVIGSFSDGVELGYIQTMDYNPADGKLYTLAIDGAVPTGFIGVIALDGTVERETNIGLVEFGALCFTDKTMTFAEFPVEGIELDKTEITLGDAGKTQEQLKVIFTPSYATNKNVGWSSDDEAVATVDENGLVTAVAVGETTIRVKTEDGGFEATCAVKVEHMNYLLYEDFENFDADNWTIVDADGDGYAWELVEGDGESGAKVYDGTHAIASASYDNNSGALTPDNWLISSAFTATADAELSWYDIGQDADWAAENYSVYAIPANYTSLDEAVELYTGVSGAEYAEHKVSLGAFAGQEIRVAFRHHDVTDMFRLNIDLITVTGTEGAEVVAVTGVELDKTEAEVAEKGTVQLTATVTPANATNKTVTWTSSDETVATVKNGVVTGVKTGEATITVTTADGGFTATCKVTVVKSEYILYEDFETDSIEDWLDLDMDGDGYAWGLGSAPTANVYEGEYCAMSASYDNDVGALTPDNWLISPIFTPDETSVLSWYVAGQDPTYAAENYGVYVLPADAEDVSEGTEIFYGTATGTYVNKTVSLADYAGQDIMIAFRHYNITDMFVLNIDLVTVTGKGETQPPVEPKTYTVKFYDGLTNDYLGQVIVEEGKDVESEDFPTPLEHEGYTFVGWDNDGKNITADVTITALYEEIVEPPVEPVDGDMNGDGKVNTADATHLLKAVAGMFGELTEEDMAKYDVNKDGKFNTQDAVHILRFVAGIITEL